MMNFTVSINITINLLKPSGYFTYHHVSNSKKFCMLVTLHLHVCGSQNEQQRFAICCIN